MRKYGWQKDKEDDRDLLYKVRKLQPISSTNNRQKYKLPAIFDQLELGSCTGNGIAAVLYFLIINGHFQNVCKTTFQAFSRLFIYWLERFTEGTVNEDSGAEIRDGIKVVAKYGAPPENLWPYNIQKFIKKPTKKVFKAALQFTALTYEKLDNTSLVQLVNCLQNGYPFVFGFKVYETFEGQDVAKSGIVPMPSASEKFLGGHCVYCIDYDMDKKGFWCVNSWGEDWGVKGLFFLPESYMTSGTLADDFWTITMIK